jgi:DNA mismatch repair protein MLH1
MIIVENPSQVAAFTDSLAVDDRPSKRRGLDAVGSAEEPVELDEEEDEPGDEAAEDGGMWKAGDDAGPSRKAGGIPESECEFTSIQELRRAVRKRGNPGEFLPFVCTGGPR